MKKAKTAVMKRTTRRWVKRRALCKASRKRYSVTETAIQTTEILQRMRRMSPRERKRRRQNNAPVQVFELLPTTRSRRDYFATTSISRQRRRIQREVEVVVRKIPTNWTISKATMSNDLLFKRKNSRTNRMIKCQKL